MEVKRKERESFEVLLRRFLREVQQSGLLTEIKSRRFYQREESRRKRRESAIRKSLRKRIKRGY